MRLSQLAPIAGLVASAAAWGTETAPAESTVYTTVIESFYTTYCPSPTTWAYKNVTYTVTSPTVITITNCPCTLKVSSPPPTTITTTYCPPTPGANTTSPYPSYANTTAPPPPPGSTTTAVVVITPPPSTYLSGTFPVTSPGGSATKTPVGPSGTPTGTAATTSGFATAGADKVGAAGALGLLAGVVALIL